MKNANPSKKQTPPDPLVGHSEYNRFHGSAFEQKAKRRYIMCERKDKQTSTHLPHLSSFQKHSTSSPLVHFRHTSPQPSKQPFPFHSPPDLSTITSSSSSLHHPLFSFFPPPHNPHHSHRSPHPPHSPIFTPIHPIPTFSPPSTPFPHFHPHPFSPSSQTSPIP